MKKVFLFLIMFFIVGAYGNNGAIESSITQHGTPVIIQHEYVLNYVTANDLLIIETKKQIICMAKNIFYEAASESTAGRLAVAQVTLNRVKSHRFPNTVCDVVYQGPTTASGFPKRNQCQFSWYCDGKGDDPKNGRLWFESQELAKHVFRYEEELVDITDGATHYHANYIDSPRWADSSKVTTSIDQHIFYNFFRM
jgi:spore germination cell wall hydrolase CwlJ-like protein